MPDDSAVVRKPFPPIPYGMADFRSIRREGFRYVDKTPFVRTLEAAKDQLRGYLADERLREPHPAVRFTGLALVFRGWELVAAEAVG